MADLLPRYELRSLDYFLIYQNGRSRPRLLTIRGLLGRLLNAFLINLVFGRNLYGPVDAFPQTAFPFFQIKIHTPTRPTLLSRKKHVKGAILGEIRSSERIRPEFETDRAPRDLRDSGALNDRGDRVRFRQCF